MEILSPEIAIWLTYHYKAVSSVKSFHLLFTNATVFLTSMKVRRKLMWQPGLGNAIRLCRWLSKEFFFRTLSNSGLLHHWFFAFESLNHCIVYLPRPKNIKVHANLNTIKKTRYQATLFGTGKWWNNLIRRHRGSFVYVLLQMAVAKRNNLDS